ncbi:MAG TPA: hypothetical protein VIG33_10020 [Pseudobdellovibrionaceae bacterium]|jgi:hypothetical protein
MKYFLKLIDVARENGIVTNPEEWETRPLTESEWDAIEKCAPFVFTDVEETVHVNGIESDLSDAPFPIFSIEGFGTEPAGEYMGPVVGLLPLYCMISIELKPKIFDYIALSKAGDEYFVLQMDERKVGPIVTSFLQDLSKKSLGQERVRTSIKIGTGKMKRLHRLRRIIHVAPRKYARAAPETHRHIDWTHRFEVRGHWRKIDTLGKDRQGKYCIHGYTWISHHEKGPETLPLVRKVRLFDQSKVDADAVTPFKL